MSKFLFKRFLGGSDMELSTEPYTGHTQENVAQTDAETISRPMSPGPSIGEDVIKKFIGVPGETYPATWPISVTAYFSPADKLFGYIINSLDVNAEDMVLLLNEQIQRLDNYLKFIPKEKLNDLINEYALELKHLLEPVVVVKNFMESIKDTDYISVDSNPASKVIDAATQLIDNYSEYNIPVESLKNLIEDLDSLQAGFEENIPVKKYMDLISFSYYGLIKQIVRSFIDNKFSEIKSQFPNLALIPAKNKFYILLKKSLEEILNDFGMTTRVDLEEKMDFLNKVEFAANKLESMTGGDLNNIPFYMDYILQIFNELGVGGEPIDWKNILYKNLEELNG